MQAAMVIVVAMGLVTHNHYASGHAISTIRFQGMDDTQDKVTDMTTIGHDEDTKSNMRNGRSLASSAVSNI